MKSIRSLILLGSLAASATCLQAADVVFTFDESADLQPTFSETVSGITLTLSNPNSNNGKFAADSEGLLLTSDPSQGPTSFQMSFSSAVQVVGYSLGFVLDGTTGTFSLDRTGATSSGNDLSSAGDFSINGTFTAAGGQTITLTSNPTGGPGWSQIKSFTVTPVPEPADFAIVGAALCGAAAFIVRNRKNS
ncbi:MAG TPA: hypothetical protein VMF06_04050 [Candidatus Limnocylindria bacterium]|jgi:hypothetical protein|nr:hypothetical protein [Candidatus Limnocylindria bacterium]